MGFVIAYPLIRTSLISVLNNYFNGEAALVTGFAVDEVADFGHVNPNYDAYFNTLSRNIIRIIE